MTLSFCGSHVGHRGIVVEFDGKSRQKRSAQGANADFAAGNFAMLKRLI
ncbi:MULTISPECIES: hypothetical protein [unclassified Pseudomonas]|nr:MULTISPECIES: hypothetical protein [unclassified Pseudomonas]MDH0302826.1 hypothetical protein [Pseudomonas sp. GD04091]MDH1984361.1 hypothetical protein [Pseudomonas sp. GD03689]